MVKDIILPYFKTILQIYGMAIYKPGDKSFTKKLQSLYIMMDTSDFRRIDNTFTIIIEDYQIPLSADGCNNGIYKG